MESGDPFSMTPVASTNLDEVGFNPDTGQGRVSFQDGRLYEYDNCTQEEFEQIVFGGSQSFGALWKGIKPYRRIG
jgi:hypothetical protein